MCESYLTKTYSKIFRASYCRCTKIVRCLCQTIELYRVSRKDVGYLLKLGEKGARDN